MIKSICSGLAALAIFASAPLCAAELPLFHGVPGSDQSYDKVVTIKPDAKWVNVTSGESVKFVDVTTGRSFVWRFDMRNFVVFDLVAVAPPGVLSHEHLTVYVAQDIRETDDH